MELVCRNSFVRLVLLDWAGKYDSWCSGLQELRSMSKSARLWQHTDAGECIGSHKPLPRPACKGFPEPEVDR